MGCFLITETGISVTHFDGIDKLLQLPTDMLIIKNRHFWELTDILHPRHRSFQSSPHVVVYEGEVHRSACSLCINRLRSLHGTCEPCRFEPIIQHSLFQPELIRQFLLDHGCYQVDKEMFGKELHYVATHQSRKVPIKK